MKIFLLFIVFFLSGCSVKHYEINEAKIIVIKSKQLKYADLGYIRNNEKSVKVELYEMGNLVQSIEINNLICMDEGCMPKAIFNARYLSSTYPSDMLKDVILGEEIFDGQNLVKTSDGFVQDIQDEKVDIHYEVKAKSILFKDRKNAILVKIYSPSQQ